MTVTFTEKVWQACSILFCKSLMEDDATVEECKKPCNVKRTVHNRKKLHNHSRTSWISQFRVWIVAIDETALKTWNGT